MYYIKLYMLGFLLTLVSGVAILKYREGEVTLYSLFGALIVSFGSFLGLVFLAFELSLGYFKDNPLKNRKLF